jgi:hypothetical protein
MPEATVDPGDMHQHPIDAAEARDAQRKEDVQRKEKREYQFHPYATKLPDLSDREFAALVEDIAENGLIDAITLCDGKILDGRNRYLACRTAGYEFSDDDFEELPEGKDPLLFVISKNFQRRHMSAEQKRAYIAWVLEERPDLSSRAIADLVGCSHTTVENVRQEQEADDDGDDDADGESTGQIGHLRTGRDGKRRRISRKEIPDRVKEFSQKWERLKEFIAGWGALDDWQRNYFVTTFKYELRERLEHIESRTGKVEDQAEEPPSASISRVDAAEDRGRVHGDGRGAGPI